MRDLHHQRCRTGCSDRFRRRYEALEGGSQAYLGFLVLTVVLKSEEYDKDTKDSVAFDKWGTSVMRCKSLNQWIAKVSSLHGDEAVTDISSLADALEVVLVKDPTILRP